MAERKTYIDPTAIVDERAEIGAGTMIWNWSKVREDARIGENCNLGQAVYVDFGVTIGDGCKIQNGVSVYHGVSLGDRVFVGPDATFTNDRVPRAFNENWQVVPTIVEQGASIGANSTIVCGVTLGAYCMVGAGAVVTRDVPAHGLVLGQPARLVDYVTVSGRRIGWTPGNPPPGAEILEEDA